MKKLMMILIAACAAVIMSGCVSTTAKWGGEEVVRDENGQALVDKDGKVQKVKQPVELKAVRHWFDSEVAKAKLGVEDGKIDFNLNGYRGETSEEFGVWTKEMWSGFAVIARLAAAAYNPATSGVPLTSDAADGENVSKLIKAKADADEKLIKAKTEQAKVKMTMQAFVKGGGDATKAEVTCENGSCTISDGKVTCTDGTCSECSVPAAQ